jgi:hypothetical protein
MNNSHRPAVVGFLIPLLLFCFVLLPRMQAAPDPPAIGGNNTRDGAGSLAHRTTGQFNTAFGTNALNSLTTGNNNAAQGNSALFSNNGSGNVAIGNLALRLNTSGFQNTAVGGTALNSNITGARNAALGYGALRSNTVDDNVAIGWLALASNTIGNSNTATGVQALGSNIDGGANTALGANALSTNTSGSNETAVGAGALAANTDGQSNTAIGVNALQNNTVGDENVAVGVAALINSAGNNNIALGHLAGNNLTAGNFNIYLGSPGGTTESNTTRIGFITSQTRAFISGIFGVTTATAATPVVVSTQGQLGTVSSSRRFKDAIKPMDNASEAILGLRPVTFCYKRDKIGTPHFGLVAEEVAEINPDLVVRDDKGEIYSVRYDAVNAMLLNEFLKEHKKVEELEATVASLATAVKEQAAQIQKVSAHLELNKPAPRTVANQ